MNVVIYARFSSDRQTEQSIEGQLKVCREFANANNYNVVGEYIDRALSGKSDNRPEFLRMIFDSNSKSFQGVLVYQLDRFSRNRYDSAIYKAKLKMNNVRVISARENITDDASGVLVEGVLESMAEYFSIELSQKVKRGMAINAEKGLSNGGKIPFGYKSVNKHLAIDEEKAPYVKTIFQMYANGSRIIDIADYLNKRGIKTSSGREFNNSSLHSLLKNKKYIGIYKYSDIEIPDAVPRLISDELFYEVADVLAKNKQYAGRSKAKVEYLLTTKLFCGHCKSMMVGYSGSSQTGKVYNYYTCNKSRKKMCNKKIVRKDFIEDLVIQKCIEVLTDDNIEIIAKEVDSESKKAKENNMVINQIKRQIKKNEKERANLMDSLKHCEYDEVRNEIFEEIHKLKEVHANLETELAEESKRQVVLNYAEIKFFLTQLRKGDINDIKHRKMLINIFVNAIYLYDDKLTIIFNSSDNGIRTRDIPLKEIEKRAKNIKSSYSNESGSPKEQYLAEVLLF